jgi:hypothetical protein
VEFLAFAGFAIVLVVVLGGFAVVWWSAAHDSGRLEHAWQVYARRRGMTFSAPSGEWPNRTVPLVSWVEDDGARYRIEARGREARVRTCVVARPAVAALGEIVVTRPGGEPGIEGAFEPLNARLVVRARPATFAKRVLTDDVKRALLGFDLGGSLSLSYRRGDVSLGWSGGEENDARLDEARNLVRRVVRALGNTRPLPGE